MAELTIRLRRDPKTGKKHVVVQYHSDEDALPIEHEEDHKRLVDQLIAGGALKAAEVGDIIVERLPEEGVPAEAPAEQEGEVEPLAEGDRG